MNALTPRFSSRALLALATAGVATLCTLPTAADEVFLDFGTADGEIGLDPTPAAEAVLRPSVSNVTFRYDLSGLEIGGSATILEVEANSENGQNVRSGGNAGIAVNGGGAKGRASGHWDLGEDLTFTLSLLDAEGADVTEGYSIRLIGAEMRWRSASGEATFNGNVVSADGTVGKKPAFVSYSFPAGEANDVTVNASRDGGDAAQLAGLQFDIAVAPEPE